METHFYRQHTADEMHLLELAAEGDKKAIEKLRDEIERGENVLQKQEQIQQ